MELENPHVRRHKQFQIIIYSIISALFKKNSARIFFTHQDLLMMGPSSATYIYHGQHTMHILQRCCNHEWWVPGYDYSDFFFQISNSVSSSIVGKVARRHAQTMYSTHTTSNTLRDGTDALFWRSSLIAFWINRIRICSSFAFRSARSTVQ